MVALGALSLQARAMLPLSRAALVVSPALWKASRNDTQGTPSALATAMRSASTAAVTRPIDSVKPSR